IKEKNKYDWDLVKKAKAIDVMKDNTYSMMLEITDDFSARASTVFDAEPKQPVIEYVPNQSKNYMLGMIEDGMVEQLRSGISESMAERYMQIIAGNIMEMTDGVEQLHGE